MCSQLPNCVCDAETPRPKDGEVRREGGNTFVWSSYLDVWVQTAYAEER